MLLFSRLGEGGRDSQTKTICESCICEILSVSAERNQLGKLREGSPLLPLPIPRHPRLLHFAQPCQMGELSSEAEENGQVGSQLPATWDEQPESRFGKRLRLKRNQRLQDL